MKVIHLSNTDSGGAIELHAAMLENGYDSSMLVAKHDLGYVDNIFLVGWYNKIKSVISNLICKKILGKMNSAQGMYSFPIFGASVSKHFLVKDADIIYLHFVAHSSFLTISEIGRILKLGKPVIFITRDMWPITGGCHTFLDCLQYTGYCLKCPCFKTKGILNFAFIEQKRKMHIYKSHSNLYFVGISNWNTNVINKSKVLMDRSVTTIQNCIDTSIFKPSNKIEARKLLNLPIDKFIIGFGARDINNIHKGGKYLSEALELLVNECQTDFIIATFGNHKENSYINEKIDQFNIGHLKDRYSMTLFYNAVDVYVNPTLFEAFGNTAAESMACGTPVVGFSIGGLKDIVDHKINGYLAEPKNIVDLKYGITQFIARSNEVELQNSCRKKILANFSRKIIFDKHNQLIHQIQGII